MVHQFFFYTTILNFPGVVREPNLWTFEPNIWWISDTQSAVSELTKSTCLFTLTTSPEIIITTINYWFSALVNLWLVLSSCLFTLFNLSGTELIINTTVKIWQWDETSTFDIVVNKRKWLSNELSTSWLIMEKLYKWVFIIVLLALFTIDQPPPQALRFSHGRGERETSDWWWTAEGPWEGYRRQAKRLLDLVLFSWQKVVFLARPNFWSF